MRAVRASDVGDGPIADRAEHRANKASHRCAQELMKDVPEHPSDDDFLLEAPVPALDEDFQLEAPAPARAKAPAPRGAAASGRRDDSRRPAGAADRAAAEAGSKP